MENYSIRNIAQREIYDSYMGILRISPLNNEDDITSRLETVEGNNSPIYLSDSDGNVLGAGILGDFSFVPKIKRVYNQYKGDKDEVILVQTKANIIYSTDSLNVRSTLRLGKDTNDKKDVVKSRKSSLKFFFSGDDASSFNSNGVLLYPVESPNDDDYFNSRFKLGTVSNISFDFSHLPHKGNERKKLLESNLRKLSTDDFDKLFESGKINPSEIVEIAGQKVYYPNEKSEAIPALRTRDYVLGHCNGHSGILTTGKTEKYFNENAEYNTIVPEKSKFTKLSYLDIDKMVWDCLEDIMSGKVRDLNGRYDELGFGEDVSLLSPLFGIQAKNNASLTHGGNVDLYNTAPLITNEVQKGIIIHSAIPFRRYLFHCLRQIARNQSDLNQTVNKFNGKIKPIKRFSNNPMNNLTKNYLLCNGNEIKYENYKNINILNNSLYKIKENSFKPLTDKNKNPQQRSLTGLYNAIKKSSANGKFKTPDLFKLNSVGKDNTLSFSPRFLRGLTWDVAGSPAFRDYDGLTDGNTKTGHNRKDGYDDEILNTEEPIQVNSDSYPNVYSSGDGNMPNTYLCYFRNDGKFFHVKDLEKQLAFKNYFGSNNIIIIKVGSYGKNFDFKLNLNPHYHYSFYKKNGYYDDKTQKDVRIVYYNNICSPYKNLYTNDMLNDDPHDIDNMEDIKNYQLYCFDKDVKHFNNHRGIPIAGNTIFRKGVNRPHKFVDSFYLPNGSNEEKGETITVDSFVNDDPSNQSLGRKIQLMVTKLDEVEGRYPIACYGGNKKDVVVGVFQCRVHGRIGTRHARVYYYWRSGVVYNINCSRGKSTSFRCVTSLPVKSVGTLGRLDVDKTEYVKDDGGKYVAKSKDSAAPSHYSLLPLIRI